MFFMKRAKKQAMLEVVAQLQRRDEFIRGLYERYYKTHGYEWIPDTPESAAGRMSAQPTQTLFVKSYYLDVLTTKFNLDTLRLEEGRLPSNCPFGEE